MIIASDKTQVTLFRNKQVYPVYLTIGNLPKELRRKPSQQGYILLGYLPVTRLGHITPLPKRRQAHSELFHYCMSTILKPLEHTGSVGYMLSSGDGV